MAEYQTDYLLILLNLMAYTSQMQVRNLEYTITIVFICLISNISQSKLLNYYFFPYYELGRVFF